MSQAHDIDPELLAELETERAYAKTSAHAERLKVEKGTSAVIRILPMKMGSNKNWFGRVGMHWHAGKPINCPVHTAPSLGGDPQAECPVCATVERLLETPSLDDETIKKLEQVRVWPKYLMYCLVFETTDKHGDVIARGSKARLVPHELWITKLAFGQLADLFKRSTKWSPTGFVDPINGCDIEMSVDMRNTTTFSIVSRGPVRDDLGSDEEVIAWTEKTCAQVKVQDTKPASLDKLEEFALKVEDLVAGRRGRPAQRRRTAADDLEEDLAPAPAGRRAAPADEPAPRRRAQEPLDDEPPARTRRAVSEDDQPRRRQPVDDEPPARTTRQSTAPEPAPRRTVEPDEPTPGDQDEDGAPPPPAPVTARRLAPPPAANNAAANNRRLPPEDRSGENDELPPPETRDPAPAVDEPPPAPPAGRPTTQRQPGRLSSALRSNLADI